MRQKDILLMLNSEEFYSYFDAMSQVHMYTKHYLLIAEEISEEGVAFLQPLKEHRDAYDHLMRVFALSSKDYSVEKAKEYALDNIKKAFGHEYRAFFDTADWFTFICRKYIREELSFGAKKKQYTNKYDDYEQVKQLINEIPFLIAEYREKKDVSSQNNILEEVLRYKSTMDELLEIYKRVKKL